MGIFGRDSREYHDDGSLTDRYDDTKDSITYDKDGSIREHSYSEQKIPGDWGLGSWQITKDGEGNVINVQDRND